LIDNADNNKANPVPAGKINSVLNKTTKKGRPRTA